LYRDQTEIYKDLLYFCSVLVTAGLRGAYPGSDSWLEWRATDDTWTSSQAPAREADTWTHNIQSAQRLCGCGNPWRYVSDWWQYHGNQPRRGHQVCILLMLFAVFMPFITDFYLEEIGHILRSTVSVFV